MSKRKPIPLYAFRPYGWSEEQSPLHCLLFYENYLLIGSGDGKIFWYNLKTLRPEKSYLPSLHSPCLQLLRSGSYLLSQSKAGDVSLWVQREGDSWIRNYRVATNHTGFCRIQAIEVVALHEANVMHLWDIRQPSGPCHSSQIMAGCDDCEGTSVPVAVDFDVATKRGVYTGMTDALGTFTVDGQTVKHFEMKHPLKMTNRGALSVIVQRPEFAVTKSRIAVVGCCDGAVRVYSWASGRPLGVLPHGDSTASTSASVQDVAFSAGPLDSLNSERAIAAAGADSCVSFWSSDFTGKTR